MEEEHVIGAGVAAAVELREQPAERLARVDRVQEQPLAAGDLPDISRSSGTRWSGR